MPSKGNLLNSLTKAFSRPELDFDFLLNARNLKLIEGNIRSRKGVGDINAVHRIWNAIQSYPEKRLRSEEEYRTLWNKLYDEAMLIPNMSHPEVVKGNSTRSPVVRVFGQKRECSNLLTAESIVQAWKTLSYPRRACGQRSYAFIGPLADLELALLSYVSTVVEKNGFRPVVVPDIIHESIPESCGLQKRSDKDILYRLLQRSDLCLSGTSEMGLSSLVKGRIFHHDELPIKMTASSRCFRPEIAKTAVENKLYRVHEFTKIEMFVVCKQDESDSLLNKLVDLQTFIFGSLGLHCRLLDMASEELGASAARKFDIEVWMPGRKLYGEVSSASNCTDYQARRLGIKYRDSQGIERFAHTCNATAIATTRAVIALLETYQNEKKGLGELPYEIQKRMPKKRSRTIKLREVPDMNLIQ